MNTLERIEVLKNIFPYCKLRYAIQCLRAQVKDLPSASSSRIHEACDPEHIIKHLSSFTQLHTARRVPLRAFF